MTNTKDNLTDLVDEVDSSDSGDSSSSSGSDEQVSTDDGQTITLDI